MIVSLSMTLSYLAIHLLALVAALGLVIDGYVFYVEGG